jgi:hypothetical protein
MIIRILICIILLIIGHSIFAPAQTYKEPVESDVPKNSSHYLGLQVNQLLRQLFNFGGSAPAVTNPYVLSYSVNSKLNGFGFATGLGYNYIQNKSSDNFISVTTTNRDFAWRFGLESKKYLSKRWLASLGGDVVIESNKTETNSANQNAPNTVITTKTNRSGFGPRATLSYQFNDKLLLGTEASFYFKWIKQKQETSNAGMPAVPDTELKSNQFTLPAAIFLIVKL